MMDVVFDIVRYGIGWTEGATVFKEAGHSPLLIRWSYNQTTRASGKVPLMGGSRLSSASDRWRTGGPCLAYLCGPCLRKLPHAGVPVGNFLCVQVALALACCIAERN